MRHGARIAQDHPEVFQDPARRAAETELPYFAARHHDGAAQFGVGTLGLFASTERCAAGALAKAMSDAAACRPDSLSDPSYNANATDAVWEPRWTRQELPALLLRLGAASSLNLAIELRETLSLRPVGVIQMFTEGSPASARQPVHTAERFRISENICCHSGGSE